MIVVDFIDMMEMKHRRVTSAERRDEERQSQSRNWTDFQIWSLELSSY